ncbi:MAG: hypothetical protein ICV68_02460 [Pyrinomonadaceae bacterium]|nr:hypothetical protein [Pyrinomonadaceae bacterium]
MMKRRQLPFVYSRAFITYSFSFFPSQSFIDIIADAGKLPLSLTFFLRIRRRVLVRTEAEEQTDEKLENPI